MPTAEIVEKMEETKCCPCCPQKCRSACGCHEEEDDPNASMRKMELACKVTSQNRKCTDLGCCCVFLLCLILWLLLSVVGLKLGDTRKLTSPTNYLGYTCGYDHGTLTISGQEVDLNLKKKKRAYYPTIGLDVMNWAQENNIGYSPDAVASLDINQLLTIKLTSICVETCPKVGEIHCTAAYNTVLAKEGLLPPTLDEIMECGINQFANFAPQFAADDGGKAAMCQNCWYVGLDTTDILKRCLEIKEQSKAGEEQCIVPNATMSAEPLLASSPDCRFKAVRTEIDEIKPGSDDPVAALLGDLASSLGNGMRTVMATIVLIITMGTIGATVFALVWVGFLRFFSGCLIWTTIWLVWLLALGFTLISWGLSGFFDTQALLGAATGALPNVTNATGNTQAEFTSAATSTANELSKIVDQQGGEQDAWKAAAIISLALFVIYNVSILWLCKQIKEAIQIVREGSKVIAAIPAVIFFPILSTFLMLGVWCWFIFSLAGIGTSPNLTFGHLASNFDEVTGANTGMTICIGNATKCGNATGAAVIVPAGVENTNLQTFFMWFIFFMFLWSSAFIHALDQSVIAGVVARWYWTRPSEELKGRKPIWENNPVGIAFKRILRFHLGSLAFGSFLIALVQFIRALFKYVEEQMKKAGGGKEQSKIMKAVFCAIHCILWCFEKSIKFISKNSFIMVAMRGHSFCKACRSSFMLIINNMKRFIAMGFITSVFIFLGKLVVVGITCLFTYFAIVANPTGYYGDVKQKMIPLAFSGFISYFVGAAILAVYELAVDTILLCFCEDWRVHESAKERVFMSKNLMRLGGIKGEPMTWESRPGYIPPGEEGYVPIPPQGCVAKCCKNLCEKKDAGEDEDEANGSDIAGTTKNPMQKEQEMSVVAEAEKEIAAAEKAEGKTEEMTADDKKEAEGL